jgi:hypothetical protein
MWTAQQLSEFIERRLGQMMHRPIMFGGTGQGVDSLFHSYLELWSRLHERYADYEAARAKRSAALKAGSAGFAFHYRRRHPDAQEHEIADYVAEQYQKIIRQLKLPVPWEQIEEERQRNLRNNV